MSAVESWSSVSANNYCRIVPGVANALIAFAKKGMKISHSIYYTTDPELDETNRILFGSRVFYFTAIKNPDELDRYWIVGVNESSTDPAT